MYFQRKDIPKFTKTGLHTFRRRTIKNYIRENAISFIDDYLNIPWAQVGYNYKTFYFLLCYELVKNGERIL